MSRVYHGQTRADDRIALEALRLRDAGLSYGEIGQRLHRTKGHMIGLLRRIDKAADAVPCECVRPENRDGGMPDGWWK